MPNVLTSLKFFRVLFVGVFLLGILTDVCAQAPDILFTRTYGGTNEDVAFCVRQTSDGGYILAGITQSFGAGFNDVYLIKTNGNGDTIWTKTYGGSNTDIGFSVQQTSDGGFIIAGFTSSGVPTVNAYLIKTNGNGDTLWTKKLGGIHAEIGYSVQQTSDSGYIVSGYTTSFGPGPQNLYLIKTDLNGDTSWTKSIGSAGDTTNGNSVMQTTDGGYIVGGTNSSPGNSWLYLVKTDANGDTLWTRNLGPGTPRAYGSSVQQTNDGGFIIGGYINSLSGLSGYLVKTNGNGDTIWTKEYGGSNVAQFTSVQQTSDSGYILTGYITPSNPNANDVYLVKTDGNGDTVWTKIIGGAGNDLGESVRQTSDGGYVIAGATNSFGAGNYDVYLIKTKGSISTQNSLRVLKLQDNDGNFSTTNDRTMKLWHLEVHSDSITGPLVGSSDTALSLNNLTDGRYCIREADSTNWIRLGYVLNGIPVTTTYDTLSVTLTGGQRDSIDFVNAPPVYSQLFRTFDQDSLALDKDNKGKVGKPVELKAVADDFSFNLTVPAAVALTAKFSMLSTGIVLNGTDTVIGWTNAKEVVTPPIDTTGGHKTVTIVGRGFSGKPMKTTYTWATLPKATKSATVATYSYNIPRLPMPNRVNGLQDAYGNNVFGIEGILIGKDYSSNADSAKLYGWLHTKKYTDVLATLYNKGTTQTETPNHGFDVFLNGKPLVKVRSSLAPTKYNNILLADLLALKVNIEMSKVGITPMGFGDLLCQVDSTRLYSQLELSHEGLTASSIGAISSYGDTLMMGWQEDSTYLKSGKTIHVPVHHFADTSYFVYLDSIVHNINAAFEGPIDTISFAPSFPTSLVYKGTRRLEDVNFLSANPNMNSQRVVPLTTGLVSNIPLSYKLEQNYPNPFNPTTTIQFSLTNPSIVTLKIYNILGQEVATLLDRVQIDQGVQNLTWNSKNLASGVYFYRLSAEGTRVDDKGNAVGTGKISFQQVKKMILLK